jgi:leucyl-tRNA synthetase
VRWFMLSDSPPERDLEWSESGIEATWRFVNRVWRLFSDIGPSASGEGLGWGLSARSDDSELGTDSPPPTPPLKGRGEQDLPLRKLLHRTIAGIGHDIEALHFNKAVAKVHELVNALEKAAPSADKADAIRALVRIVSPMLPHLAEEGWEAMGGSGLIAHQPWPAHDPALLVDDEVTIAVQVNGKLRDTLTVAKAITKEELEALALASEKVIRSLDGAAPKKVIVVPGRLVNIVA